MQRDRVLLRTVVLCFVPCALAGASRAQVELSGPLARAFGRFHEFQVSPDGTRVVYAAEQELYGAAELYSAPVDGAAPAVKISGTYAGGEYARMLFTPDSSRVVYVLDEVGLLLSTPVDGSSPPIQLASVGCANCDDSDFAFTLSADGSHVLYRDEQYDHHPLYAVPVDGSSPAAELGGTLYWVPFPPVSDGTTVAFLDHDGSQMHLYRRPIDAGASAKRLDLGMLRSEGPPLLAPDGSVVFLGDDEPLLGDRALLAVPLDGSAAPRPLSGALVSFGQVHAFALADGGTQVVYRADALVDGQDELFAVPLDGSAPPRRLNRALATGGNVLDFELSADGTRAVYRAMEAGVVQLWSARVDEPHQAVRLNGRLVAGGNVLSSGLAEPPGAPARVVFLADAHVDGQTELYSVPLDGSLRPHALQSDFPRVTRLRIVLFGGPWPSGIWQVAAGGERVLYFTDGDGNGTSELYSVPVRGGPSVRLDEEVGPGGAGPRSVLSSSLGRALFFARADYRVDEALLSVPLAGGAATRLNGLHARGPEQGYVRSYVSKPDGEHVVYIAQQDHLGHFDLYAVPSDGSAAPVKLHDAGAWSASVPPPDMTVGVDGASFRLTADGARVVHLADPDGNGRHELFVAPLDASAPALALGSGEGVQTGFALAPADAQVVFLRSDEANVSELWRVPLDASAAPTRLSGTLVAGGDVEAFALAPDGSGVAFRADAELDGRFELYSVPLAGGARVRLSPALTSEADVGRFQLTPDSAYALFVADARVDGQLELYSAPLAGGAPAKELDPALTGSGNVLNFAASPDSTRAVFVASSDAQKLWSVPCDGSAVPVRLDGPLVAGGRVRDDRAALLLSAETGRVLYVADQDVLHRYELWSVPLDGSAPAVRRNDPAGLGLHSRLDGLLALAPGGRRVLYLEAGPSGVYEPTLVRTTVAGPGPRLALTAGAVPPSSFTLDPFGLLVLYVGSPPGHSESPALYLAPCDASRPPRRIDLGPAPCTGVFLPSFTPDGRFALWLDESVCGAAELWSMRIPRRLRASEPPAVLPP